MMIALAWDELAGSGGFTTLELDDARNAAAAPSVPDAAGCWAVPGLPGRFLVWRTVANALYIVETSLHSVLERNALKLVFGANIVPSIVITAVSGALRVLALTTRNTIYRVTLHLNSSGESVLSALYQSQGFVPRAHVEVFPVFAPHLSFARCAPGHSDTSLLLVASQTSHPLHVATLYAPDTVPQLDPLVASASTPQAVCTLQQEADSFAFIVHSDGSLSAYSLQSRTRVVTMQLPVSRSQALRITALDGRNSAAALTVLASDGSVVQVEVTLRSNALSMDVQQHWAACAPASAVMDFCAPAAGSAWLALSNGAIARCAPDGQVQVQSNASQWQFNASDGSGDEAWRLMCHALLDDDFLVPDLFFPQLADKLRNGAVLDFDVDTTSRNPSQLRADVCAYGATRCNDRPAFLRTLNECLALYRNARFLCCIGDGLVVAVCGGGVATLLPPLPSAPVPVRVASLLTTLLGSVPGAQWALFDHECATVTVEEAALGLVRWILTASDLGVRVPQTWRSLGLVVEDIVAAAEQALRIPMMWTTQTVTVADMLQMAQSAPAQSIPPSQQSAAYLGGPISAHAAAWTIRAQCDAIYTTLRSLLTLALVLLHSQGGKGVHGVVNALSVSLARVARLRHAARTAGLWKGVALTTGAIFSRLQLTSEAPVRPMHLLCVSAALLALAEPPLLLMRALHCAQQWATLARLAGNAHGPVCLHYSALCRLQRGDGPGALAGFQSALHAALSDDPASLSLLSCSAATVMEPTHLADQYWMAAMMEFERAGMLDMVVKTARIGVRSSRNPHVFWVWCFRHNLLLKNYSEAFMDIQASAAYDGAENVARRLRLFLVDMTTGPARNAFCEFPFAGRYVGQVADMVLELARAATPVSGTKYETLYAFHIYRSQYREAATVMYELALRFQSEGHSNWVANVADALASSLSALRMLPVAQQWIPTPALGDHDALTVTLDDMQRQYTLARARAVLRGASAPVDASEAFTLLVSAGRVAHALQLGRAFSLDLSSAFTAMATSLVQGAPLFDADDEWADLGAGERPAVTLERLVRQYDNRASNYAYARSVAVVLLQSRERALPMWLSQWLLERNAAALLQLYVSHVLLDDAVRVVRTLLEQRERLLPLSTIDVLLAELDDDARGLLSDKIQSRLQ